MEIQQFNSENDLKQILARDYQKQINNYFGDEQKALKFLSCVVSSVQQTPELLECEPTSVINSFVKMAQLELMPSDVSGEAYVLPYKNNKKGVSEAQFQLGYQGWVTLLYRAGNREVISEQVREQDVFTITNGKVHHEVDPTKTRDERGAVIGAYAIIVTPNAGSVEQFMRKEDIHKHAQKFSKSYGSKYSPWSEENDPEGWMLRKTVLKQTAKLAPKSGALQQAIAEDNKDSVIHDRFDKAKKQSEELKTGKLLTQHGTKKDTNTSESDQAGQQGDE